ncbi:prephenate dehydrogenase/arogenate dehydrogenase family protein [Fusibacter bizertensis]
MKNSEEDFKNIGIIGLGLIGGSVAKALKHSAFDGKVYGLSHNELTVEKAYADGVIDNAQNDFAKIVKQCDLIILATPISTYAEILEKIRDDLPKGCLITDVGSVKTTVHASVAKVLNGSHRFIGGHPMAGSEKSGYSVSKAHLFENAYYFLTVETDGVDEGQSMNHDTDLQRLWRLVELLGGKPHLISPQSHDHMVARTSHLPHISASLLVQSLGEEKSDLIHFVGGGFRDATRIAAGDPKLWRDILTANKLQIVSAMEDLMSNLEKCKAMILSEDTRALEAFLTESKLTREGIPKHLVDTYDQEYALYIDVKDQPGVIAQVASLMAVNDINIKDIEIIHAREHIPGVLKIGYYTDVALENAKLLLNNTLFNWSEACKL